MEEEPILTIVPPPEAGLPAGVEVWVYTSARPRTDKDVVVHTITLIRSDVADLDGDEGEMMVWWEVHPDGSTNLTKRNSLPDWFTIPADWPQPPKG
jgi:hypothetical protein